MKLSVEEAAKVAKLARLKLSEEKLERFCGQLDDILSYMDLLNSLDTKAIEPLYSPSEHACPMRPDEPKSEYSREEILQNAPETDGRFFIVPKIV